MEWDVWSGMCGVGADPCCIRQAHEVPQLAIASCSGEGGGGGGEQRVKDRKEEREGERKR